jgi:hypothetical protein
MNLSFVKYNMCMTSLSDSFKPLMHVFWHVVALIFSPAFHPSILSCALDLLRFGTCGEAGVTVFWKKEERG